LTDTKTAIAGNYLAKRSAGAGRLKSAGQAGLTATGATFKSGVNTLVARHGRQTSAERITASTAKIKAKDATKPTATGETVKD